MHNYIHTDKNAFLQEGFLKKDCKSEVAKVDTEFAVKTNVYFHV